MVAAFTSFSAFDYLHEGRFDAVIMNALEHSEPALTIAETMRKNSELYHIPTLFLIGDEFSDYQAAYQSGARDLINADSDPEEISGRILELANYHRIHEQLKSEVFSIVPEICRDDSGAVFSFEFYEKHLARLIQDAEKSAETVSLLAVRMIPQSQSNLEHVDFSMCFSEAAKIVRDLVRMQDLVCLESDTFLLAFYSTSKSQTLSIQNRIVTLLEDKAFTALSDHKALLTLSCQSAVYEIQSNDSVEVAISNLINELETSGI